MWFGIAAPLIVFELLGYVCLGLCLWHALLQGPLRQVRLIELGTGVLYGLTLETLTIVQLHAYTYGHFLIMFGPVPFAVGVGWGIILYSAMAFVDISAISAWAAPALVGLLGLNIDLAMDSVAVRLHMWQWLSLTSNEQWFGVPYANFYAWVIVLSSFSGLLWLVRPLTAQRNWRAPLAALGALLGSVVILALLDEFVVQYDAHGGIVWLPFVILVAGALIIVAWGFWVMRSTMRTSRVKAHADILLPMIVPFYFHFFFIAMLFVAHIVMHLPVLLGISLAMLVLSFVVYGVWVSRTVGIVSSVWPSATWPSGLSSEKREIR